jgi:hypothetical protein
MPARSVRFALAAAAALVLLIVTWQCSPTDTETPTAPAGDFSFERVELVSNELALDLQAVRGKAHESYTDWSCIFICRESGGCNADVQLEVLFSSAGEERRLILAGRLVGERGDALRLGRVQRPPVNVDAIERLTLRVVDTYKPGQPTPTPME